MASTWSRSATTEEVHLGGGFRRSSCGGGRGMPPELADTQSAGLIRPALVRAGGIPRPPLHQLEIDHLRRVGLPRPELDDPGVAAGPLGVTRRDFLEQLVDDELVVVEGGQRLAPGVQVAPLGESDQLLDLGLDRLCLRLAGFDPLVLDQLLGEVREERAPMCGVAAELVSLLAMPHRAVSVSASVLLEVEASRMQGLDHFL